MSKELYVVFDESDRPCFCAAWKDACNEHINDALDMDLTEAARWKIRVFVPNDADRPAPAGDGGKLIRFIDRAIAQEERACRVEDMLIDLVNQIRKTSPVDDHGHSTTMNAAYLKAVKYLDDAARHERDGADADNEPHRVQWWLAKVDSYGTARPFDGPHETREGADQAAYLMHALKLQKDGEKYAVVEARVTEPRPTSKGVNHEAVAQNLLAKRGGAS